MFIEIKNKGEMDLNALTLIGASTKRDDTTKIGYFGSGLKYALAVLIRNGVMPKIYIGNRLVDIAVKAVTFCDKIFNQIMIEGQPTSLTIEMGVDWEPWFAIREIYCNALDEKNPQLRLVQEISPEDGFTSIYIDNIGIFDELLLNWDKYFNIKRNDKIIDTKDFKVFAGGDEYIMYRRGVRCYYEKTKTLYHYDSHSVQINESRTLFHSVDYIWHIAEKVAQHATRDMICNIFDNSKDHVEDYFRWDQCHMYFNPTWLEVLGGRKIIIRSMSGNYIKEQRDGNCIILRSELAYALKKRFPKEVKIVGQSDKYGGYMIVDQTARQQSYIDQAKAFLDECGIVIDQKIEVCVFENSNVLGQAIGDGILISVDCFERGKREIVQVILEEYLHIKHDLKDESRGMQDFLLNKIVSLFEEKTKVFL